MQWMSATQQPWHVNWNQLKSLEAPFLWTEAKTSIFKIF